MIPYNLYRIDFNGFYPIGAYAIIAASDKSHAKKLFLAELAGDFDPGIQQLATDNKNIPEDEFEKLPGTHVEDTWVYIFSYGNY